MREQSALYIVATPIGNLTDITLRAIEVLRNVDVVAAEDTRHSARLLQHHCIATPLISYHDHGGDAQLSRVLDKLVAGESVALISDAGTPLISDPGYRLVREARNAGIAVVPLPGPCAFVAALSASGLPSDRFCFEGFPSAKKNARLSHFERLASETRTLVFYESTHRILDSLEDMAEAFGSDRECVIGRELTKSFETFLCGSIASVIQALNQDHNQRKGEFVVMVAGFAREESDDDLPEVTRHTLQILLEELPLKQAAALAAKITGDKKNRLYQWALARK